MKVDGFVDESGNSCQGARIIGACPLAGRRVCPRIWPNGLISLPVYTCLASDLSHIVHPGNVIDVE